MENDKKVDVSAWRGGEFAWSAGGRVGWSHEWTDTVDGGGVVRRTRLPFGADMGSFEGDDARLVDDIFEFGYNGSFGFVDNSAGCRKLLATIDCLPLMQFWSYWTPIFQHFRVADQLLIPD